MISVSIVVTADKTSSSPNQCVTRMLPSVNVPVLSKKTVPGTDNLSKHSPERTKTRRLANRPTVRAIASGVASLAYTTAPWANGAPVAELLVSTARPVGAQNPGLENGLGSGCVDASRLVRTGDVIATIDAFTAGDVPNVTFVGTPMSAAALAE